MNLNPQGYCPGVVVICTFALLTFYPGVCEPVGQSRPSEQGHNNDMQSVLSFAKLKAKRQHLGSRPGNFNIHPKFMTSVEYLGETSTSGLSSMSLNHGQNNPPNNLKTNCNEGVVQHIVQGRFDFAADQSITSTHRYPSGSTHSDTQVSSGLQPVVRCTETSMTLTVSRRWAAQLRVGTGNDFSFSLSKLPTRCGYSIHKSWREISIGVQYNGCHVTQEGGRYVLPLLWWSTPVKISCPVSPMKFQAFYVPSLCCSPFGLTIRIQDPSAARKANVKVRGEWTPLLELVDHCGYTLDQTNAQTVIGAPFLACGITSRNGYRTLSLQIGEEVFMLTCSISTTEIPQHQSPQPTISTKPTLETLKPLQWVPPFYLAPPHYPHPKHHHKTHVHGHTPLPPTMASFDTRQLETPQQDEQQNDRIPDKNYHNQASWRGSVKVFPHLKHTSIRTHSPEQATVFSPPLLPHNYAFNPFYHFYHHPKIPLTNQPPDPGSVVKPSEMTDKTPNLVLAPKLPKTDATMPHNSFFHHDIRRTNFQNPVGSIHVSPRSTSASPIHTMEPKDQGIDKKIWPGVSNEKDFELVTPPAKLPSPPYGSPIMPNTPMYMLYHLPPDFSHLYQFYHGSQGENSPTSSSSPLPQQTPNPSPPSENLQNNFGSYFPHDFYQLYRLYHLYHGAQGENVPTLAPFPLPQQTSDSIPPSEDPKDSFGSKFQSEHPVQAKPGSDPVEGLNNEDESVAHSDPSSDGNSWEKWFNMAANMNYVPEPLYMFHSPFPVPEGYLHQGASVQGHMMANSMAQPLASPCCPGTGSCFHHSISPGCFTFPVKECTVGEDFVFLLPELEVEPKVVGSAPSEVSCALKRQTSNPHLYFVPLHGCGVTKQAIGELVFYQLELETCGSDNSLIRMLVECRSYPGFASAEILLLLYPFPLQYPVPLQLRIVTDESYSYHPEAHLPLSRLQGRLLLMELSLLQPPDPSAVLRVHYCLAFTLSPYASAMLIYDGCLPGSESQLLPSRLSNTQYIVVTSFRSLHLPSTSIDYDVDPEVYFLCLTEMCSASDNGCSASYINSSEQK